MSRKPKVGLIARLYVDMKQGSHFLSDFVDVGVCFNFINADRSRREDGAPYFADDYCVPKNRVGLRHVEITSQISRDYPKLSNMVSIESRNPRLSLSKAREFVKAGDLLDRIGQKSQIYPNTFEDTLFLYLSELGLKTILFEEFSETNGENKWKEYPLNRLNELLAWAENKGLSKFGLDK